MEDAPHPSEAGLLREVVGRILGVRRPQAIILFGSQARKDARRSSDLDLLIIEQANSEPRHRRALPYRMALLGIDRDIDVVVYTPNEIDEWAGVPNAFITTVLREGKVLYHEDGRRPGARLAG